MRNHWEYRSQYGAEDEIRSNPGNSVVDKFVLSTNDQGQKYLKKVGTTDLYADIQSHRDSCDLNLILNNLDVNQVNGLVSSFSFSDFMNSDIFDMTSLPKTIGGLHNLVVEGEDYFAGLPLPVREAFNFSPSLFISKFGTSEFKDKIKELRLKYDSTYKPPVEPIVAPVEPVASVEPVAPVEPVKTTVKRSTRKKEVVLDEE